MKAYCKANIENNNYKKNISLTQINVLILGLGPVGIGILRSLRNFSDLKLYGIVFDPNAEKGKLSRWCHKFIWPDPRTDEKGFANCLISWANSYGRTIVFATRDEEVLWLSENASILPQHLIFYRNSSETIKKMDNKIFSSVIARSVGIRVPESVISGNESPDQPVEFRFPVIIKPFSVPPAIFTHKNLLIHSLAELTSAFKKYPSLRNYSIIQEYIPGEDSQVYQCTALVGQNGAMLGSIEFKKIHQYPVGRGIACYGHTLRHCELSHLCKALAKATNIKGLISVEFKKDYRDNQWVFIEANLRMPGYNSVFSRADVNLARVYIDDLLQQYSQSGSTLHNKKVLYWMREELDLSNVLKRRVNISIWGWFKNFIKTNSFAFWHIRDPFPGFWNIWQLLSNILSGHSKNQ